MEKLRTLRPLLLSDRHPCPEHDRLCPNHRKVSGGLSPTRRSLFGELVVKRNRVSRRREGYEKVKFLGVFDRIPLHPVSKFPHGPIGHDDPRFIDGFAGEKTASRPFPA